MKNFDKEIIRDAGCALGSFFLMLFLFICLCAICGCTTTKYVPVERVRTEYKEADTTAIYNRLMYMFESLSQKESGSDSLIDRTNEKLVLNDKGDTITHEKVRIVYRSTRREKELEEKAIEQDSIIKDLKTRLASAKTDSVPVPYPVEKRVEVPRESSWWETALMWCGAIALAACGWLTWRKLKG